MKDEDPYLSWINRKFNFKLKEKIIVSIFSMGFIIQLIFQGAYYLVMQNYLYFALTYCIAFLGILNILGLFI